ncbi:carbon catabolite repressor protein 4 homolog 4 isoform X3 [Rhododendron vialii]|uniref:carbon catabolite repressor protein 4 homolog 4 isoform X3 n=1 Tax=Rhododendron vialii TaxID=182163 RepID=UPI00265D96F4|nr:carbon catabolite repressor protein 4 homolog 4 isoform X3 [Rhododendron vialii]
MLNSFIGTLKVASSLPRLPLRRFCLSTMTTPSCPEFKPVEHSGIASISKPDGFKFRLVSYNILAQAYAKSEQFPHSPSPCRKWKTRSQAILNLLKGLEADFLCLQEVDEYDSFYKGNLESHGYASVYIRRSRKKPDGCGIFYKHKNVELILEEKIEYNDLVISVQDETTAPLDTDNDALAVGNEDTEQQDGLTQKDNDGHCGDPNDPRVRLKRDCVGIMAAFKLKDPSQHVVIVANTHLYWDPNWADVKLAQAKYLLARLAQFKILVSHKFECSPSVIVGGDFNSTPGDKVYQYLTSGSSPMGSSVELFEDLPIPMCSFYAHTRGEPPFTNCTPDFTDTLDYILFSPSDAIRPVSYLELPEPESPDVIGGLPNYHHPSDHLPIGAEFEVL